MKKIIKRFLPITLILIGIIIAYSCGLHHCLSYENLKEHHVALKQFMLENPIASPLIFIGVYILSTLLTLPSIALSTFGGFLFPQPWSTLYTTIAATISGIILFLCARTAFGDFLKEKAGRLLKKMEKGFKKDRISYLFFIRLVPISPFFLVNVAAALFRVPLWTFIWTTFLGMIPSCFVFAEIGSGLKTIFESDESFSFATLFNTKIKVAVVGLALIALVPVVIRRLRKHKR